MAMKIGSGYLFYIPDQRTNKINHHTETFEGKLEKMKIDAFKKKYAIFSDIENKIKEIKLSI